jgi:hypothetical protein
MDISFWSWNYTALCFYVSLAPAALTTTLVSDVVAAFVSLAAAGLLQRGGGDLRHHGSHGVSFWSFNHTIPFLYDQQGTGSC